MENILDQQEKALEAVAEAFATHPDFAQARADEMLWEATVRDGLEE